MMNNILTSKLYFLKIYLFKYLYNYFVANSGNHQEHAYCFIYSDIYLLADEDLIKWGFDEDVW